MGFCYSFIWINVRIGVACIVTISCFNINLNGRKFLNANGKRYCLRRANQSNKRKKRQKERKRKQLVSEFKKMLSFLDWFCCVSFLLEYYWSFFHFCSQRDFHFFLPRKSRSKTTIYNKNSILLSSSWFRLHARFQIQAEKSS